MADKNYEKAEHYSTARPDVLKMQFEDDDFSGLKYKSQTVDDDKFAGFIFENKDGKIFNCLVDKEKGKVCIGTGFSD